MSQQLTISSLFAALALVTLAMFARAGDLSTQAEGSRSIVLNEAHVATDA